MENSSHSQSDCDGDQSSPTSFSRLPAGHLIGDRYEVLAHIGSGGMGEVYKVLDRSTQQIYALKMISQALAEQRTLAKRLEHEAQAARTLVHGNIVSVYDVGKALDGAPYLIMDYVEGDSLEAFLKKEVLLRQERALPIFIQIAEALVHAQQKGIVHRDLKPSNILITKTDGGADMVKIVDFGIAKISDQDRENKTKLTQTGELLGTPLYMSPEQCTGDELDIRADIYSLGCIMYELLCGKAAFAAENPVKVILKHLNEEHPPFPKNAGISPDLQRIVSRCMEKLKQDRYASAVELQIDLERVLEGRKIKRHFHRRKKARQKWAVAVGGGLLLLCGGAGFVLTHNMGMQAGSNNSDLQPQLVESQPRPEYYAGKSLAQWTNAIEAAPEEPELYLNRGILHGHRDERTNAIDDFTQAIALKPDYLEAYHERATMYVMLAQLDKAATDANKLIALAPDSAASYETRAWVYGAREQYGEAIADWKRALQLSDNGYYNYHLANIQLKLADYQSARTNIDAALSSDGRERSYFGVAGMISTFQNQLDEAKVQLEQATNCDDSRGVEWQMLAFYELCAGNPVAAERALQRAKSLETFPARSYRLAGEYYRTAGDLNKALAEFSASTSLEEYAPGYRQKAVTSIALGQWRSALTDLKKSYQLNPYSPTTSSYLALVEDHLG
ncbi:MAG TPA: protein kinase, partial [Chroococcales cyanobacterium]